MDRKEFNKLIKKDRYQVFLFSSPIPLPFSFIKHHWFVTNNKGKIHRWEMIKRKTSRNKIKGNFREDFFIPTRGIKEFYWRSFPKWRSKLEFYIKGKKGSVAQKMVKFLEKESKKYPFSKNYKHFGPNCNTFIQWVINKFPESKFKLSWIAIGKNYEK